jgi:ubiquinol-cytochrome c reductase cytochrome b subunit
LKARSWFLTLLFYALLRAIPHKVGGIVIMGSSLIILFFLPFIHFSKIRAAVFRLIYRNIFFLILITFILLIWLGNKPTENPYTTIGQFLTFSYFFLFLIGIPFSGIIDSHLSTLSLKK